MSTAAAYKIKEARGLSPRITWLRDYYFKGAERAWNNEYTAWTTGMPWDVQFDEMSYYIVPEMYAFNQTFRSSFQQSAHPVDLHPDFWKWSLVERKAWFTREVMVNYVPREILPGDLLAGARFNLQGSRCWNKKEAAARDRMIYGKKGARATMKWFHDHGYGNSGATSGHLIPWYERVLKIGWKGIYTDLETRYNALNKSGKKGPRGAQLRAMMTAATMPRDLAHRYSELCAEISLNEKNTDRKQELELMAKNLASVPWEPAENLWEAVQSLWITHMLIMSDENYPGPGVSFGRFDQYLLPYWRKSIAQGMDRDFGKEILKCFWFHCNTVYDAMVKVGNQGITSGFGQLITLSGMGKDGKDMTNELTCVILEVIDEMTPILEPKPNVRLHRNTPEELLDTVVDMISSSQGAPFLLNFDERSMAGMMREARRADIGHLINEENVHDYAPVGCLENTMQGNDRSGTVDNNINLLKAVELALTGGKDLLEFTDMITGKTDPVRQDGPRTGDAKKFRSWDEFWAAYASQTRYLIKKCVSVYEQSERIRAELVPTPYLSCLVKGCAEKGVDVTAGGAEISFVTIEGVTFATTVDSLLAIKYLVFDKKECTMEQLITALRDNWEGHDILQAKAKNRAPKYGQDDNEADAMALAVMDLWTGETWKYRTKSTGRRFRPGMLSWNYWVGDGYVMAASADGRPKGQFLSNAICPSNGADVKGPTANTNSVGKALGGISADGAGDWNGYVNSLPNGASHTITFSPSLIRDPEHRAKFKAFLRGYAINGGTALQVNMVDADMLRDAQEHPRNYRHLLVRVTGYNAYFTAIGRELQDEIIARESHKGY
ncbi:MAG TPA: pyruvate formate lyase family protein [Spirochaetota bacterium]|nr:pyruvate formate lyase family protein [Spirochaetota bacterium]HPI90441.1 pyruvate formate lyase family protein [Spirochaetota bacterium]HPR49350.1 pyruvate formate lyase family protein [Spirochaetota bacterium]